MHAKINLRRTCKCVLDFVLNSEIRYKNIVFKIIMWISFGKVKMIQPSIFSVPFLLKKFNLVDTWEGGWRFSVFFFTIRKTKKTILGKTEIVTQN